MANNYVNQIEFQDEHGAAQSLHDIKDINDKHYGLMNVIKITDPTTTMGDVQTMLNEVNTNGDHVLFDVSALGAGMYLCTMYLGTGYFRINDLVTGHLATGFWTSSELLKDKIEGGASQSRHYTVQWDKTNAQMTRLNDAASITTNVTNFKHNGSVNPNYDNPFDSIYPWSERKLCNIDIDLYRSLAEGADIKDCVVAWDGDADFSYDHQYGVWVYTPSFYGRCFEIGNYRYFDVTDEEIADNIYYPAQITGRYLGTDVTLTIDGTSKHCLLPTLGQPLANVSVANQHTYAKNYGGSVVDIYNLDASTLLYLVEFANWNIQNTLGSGVSSLYQQSLHLSADVTNSNTVQIAANANIIVGATIDIGTSDGGFDIARTWVEAVNGTTVTLHDAVTATTAHIVTVHGLINLADEGVGSMSGYIGTNGKSNAYYRGESLFANRWQYILGAYRQTGTGEIWVSKKGESDNYDALNVNDHIDTGLALTETSGYVQTFGIADGLSAAPFCTAIGGNSTNPVGDYCYVPALTTGNTILLFGGYSNSGPYAGFCGYWNAASSISGWNYCSRPRLLNP